MELTPYSKHQIYLTPSHRVSVSMALSVSHGGEGFFIGGNHATGKTVWSIRHRNHTILGCGFRRESFYWRMKWNESKYCTLSYGICGCTSVLEEWGRMSLLTSARREAFRVTTSGHYIRRCCRWRLASARRLVNSRAWWWMVSTWQGSKTRPENTTYAGEVWTGWVWDLLDDSRDA